MDTDSFIRKKAEKKKEEEKQEEDEAEIGMALWKKINKACYPGLEDRVAILPGHQEGSQNENED
jgi:hypothetical protein